MPRVDSLQVVVASRNPVKLRAVETAFRSTFAEASIETVAASGESGVADQPMTDSETRLGARNRAINVARNFPDAHYFVGLEGGIEISEGRLVAFAWMAVRDRDGRLSDARSVTLPLPPAVQELVEQGLELGEANDRVFSTVNSKQGGGAFGLLTDGRLTREGVYAQTLEVALVPFSHPLFAEPD